MTHVAVVGRPAGALRIGVVTHYVPPHIGGVEIVAQALLSAYQAAGCEVRWVASRVAETEAAERHECILVGSWNGLERWWGVPWPLWGPAGIREVARLVRWADVLHVHDCLYLGSALAVLLARRARKPALLSQHIGFVRYTSPALNGLETLAYHTIGYATLRSASYIVFCTPTAEEFVKPFLGKRLGPSSAIPNGIDTGRFHLPSPLERATARQRLGVPESSRVVLFVGRLVGKKGVDMFLDVSRRSPSFHFLMVGDGPLRPQPANNLTWVPFIPVEQIERAYRAADTFLLPSHSEGFPLTIQEAMATGVPVITSRGQTFAALLEREGACLAVDRTPEAFCEALTRLWETPGLLQAMTARARDLVMREWSLDTMGARYVSIIQRLAMKGPADGTGRGNT